MAPTPYPDNLFHSGAAQPLTLDVGLTVPPSGDIVFTVSGNAASKGWPTIPVGQKMVVTVARGEPEECKYLVSSVSSGQTSSTFTVLAADRNYDGTPPVNAPPGATVEHTVSATEMATINDHMRTRQAHGSDGDLVDQNSAQSLSNKVFADPTAPGHPATKQYVDTADTTVRGLAQAAQATADAALPKAGGTGTGDFTFNQKVQVKGRLTGASTESNDLIVQATAGQVDVRGPNGLPASGWIAHSDAQYANQSATLGQVNAAAGSALNAANTAQATANQARSVADAALPKAGGTVSGSLAVSGTLSAGPFYLFDSTTPNASPSSEDRWLIYKGDGRVHRIDHAMFEFYIRGIIQSSTARLKSDVQPAQDAPDIFALRAFTYRWDEDGAAASHPGQRYGLIAEQVADVDERLCMRDAEGNVAGLDTHALIAALISEVSSLRERVQALEGNVTPR